ncbi:hypothetical protein F4776DRAFT_333408 [Hypoxylon sp. NC0597]|nr:hypothetical protein F4776DRAFT_333408 [Hypoxylon sp. NC0597]
MPLSVTLVTQVTKDSESSNTIVIPPSHTMEEEKTDNFSEKHVSEQHRNNPISRPTHTPNCDPLVLELDSVGIDGSSSAPTTLRPHQLGRNDLDDSTRASAWKIVVAHVAKAMVMARIFTYID